MYLKFVILEIIFLIAVNSQNVITKDYDEVVMQKPKNVIIIMADDMGFYDVSYRGSDEIMTPNIDALGFNGVILDRHYTPPMCTPSRSALLTGKYPHHNGMQHYVIVSDEPWGLPLDDKIMPEYFKEAGYDTHLIGKWHLGFFKEEYAPTRRGFDSFFGYLGPYIDYWDYTLEMFTRNYSRGYDLRRNLAIDRNSSRIYATDLFTSEAVEVIENHDENKPLFLLLNHLAPHSANDDDPLQAKEEDEEIFSYIENTERKTLAAMIKALDRGVGEVVAALSRKNILKDSIIVFYSDNGGASAFMHGTSASNYPLRSQKNTAWEGGIRTNAIIYAPFLPSGVVRKENFYVADYLPTLLKLANTNVKVDRKIDGNDLSGMIKFQMPPFRDEIITIDDLHGYSSFILRGFKIVNGSSSEGEADGWLGSNNNSDINSATYIRDILNSKVSRELRPFSNHLNPRTIQTLRNELTVKCIGKFNKCDLLESPCLFNIIDDPCEESNLIESNDGKMLFEMLLIIFNDRLKDLVPSHRKPKDPKCDPINFNYTWSWWE